MLAAMPHFARAEGIWRPVSGESFHEMMGLFRMKRIKNGMIFFSTAAKTIAPMHAPDDYAVPIFRRLAASHRTVALGKATSLSYPASVWAPLLESITGISRIAAILEF